VTTKGFLASRVFRAVRDDINRFFIPYELEAREVLDGEAYLARLNAPTPWSQRIMPKLGNFMRGGGIMVARAGRGEGATIMALRIEKLPGDPQKLAEALVAFLCREPERRVAFLFSCIALQSFSWQWIRNERRLCRAMQESSRELGCPPI
jgi:hypothetical protein